MHGTRGRKACGNKNHRNLWASFRPPRTTATTGNVVVTVVLVTDHKERDKERQAGDGVKQSVARALESCERNQDNLTKLRYRELIGDEEFIRQKAELGKEGIRLKQRLEDLKTESWIEPSRRLFLFSNRAVFWLTHGTIDEKRLILATVGSNLSFTAKKLNMDAQKPFEVLRKNGEIRNWCTIVNDVRTFFREEPGFAIPLLPEPDLIQLKAA